MPTLRELKKRLKSAGTIEQLAGAMRTAATAKYLKTSKALEAFIPYNEALKKASAIKEGGKVPDTGEGKTLFILLSGSHGLCGGYHHELFSFFSEKLAGENSPYLVAACGQKAIDHCANCRLDPIKSFPSSDLPSFDEAKSIAAFVKEAVSSGEVGRVRVVYQSFVNMLKQVPTDKKLEVRVPDKTEDETDKRRFGKRSHGAAEDGPLFVPDRETAASEIDDLTLASELYSMLLSSAAGFHSATVIAMRAAYDNAKKSIAELNTDINRIRQATVTASVLETSANFKE